MCPALFCKVISHYLFEIRTSQHRGLNEYSIEGYDLIIPMLYIMTHTGYDQENSLRFYGSKAILDLRTENPPEYYAEAATMS